MSSDPHDSRASSPMQVVVTFTGCMDSRGFNRGRISAVLRRKSAYEGGFEASAGECVGYSPHSRQKLNLGDEFYQTPGTIVIQHCPRRVPLACSTYEVEVTALGPTAYEVVVVAGQCESCASLVDKRLEEARKLKVKGACVSSQVFPRLSVKSLVVASCDVLPNKEPLCATFTDSRYCDPRYV